MRLDGVRAAAGALPSYHRGRPSQGDHPHPLGILLASQSSPLRYPLDCGRPSEGELLTGRLVG